MRREDLVVFADLLDNFVVLRVEFWVSLRWRRRDLSSAVYDALYLLLPDDRSPWWLHFGLVDPSKLPERRLQFVCHDPVLRKHLSHHARYAAGKHDPWLRGRRALQ